MIDLKKTDLIRDCGFLIG